MVVTPGSSAGGAVITTRALSGASVKKRGPRTEGGPPARLASATTPANAVAGTAPSGCCVDATVMSSTIH